MGKPMNQNLLRLYAFGFPGKFFRSFFFLFLWIYGGASVLSKPVYTVILGGFGLHIEKSQSLLEQLKSLNDIETVILSVPEQAPFDPALLTRAKDLHFKIYLRLNQNGDFQNLESLISEKIFDGVLIDNQRISGKSLKILRKICGLHRIALIYQYPVYSKDSNDFQLDGMIRASTFSEEVSDIVEMLSISRLCANSMVFLEDFNQYSELLIFKWIQKLQNKAIFFPQVVRGSRDP
jgi:hypothetical protein